MERFCDNSSQLKDVKNSASCIFDWIINTPLICNFILPRREFAAQEFCQVFTKLLIAKYFRYLASVCVTLLLKRISPVKSKQKTK